jgi:hypothetical protein
MCENAMKDFSRALFLVADNQNDNKGDVGDKYCHGAVLPYETELLCCIKSWRQNGGQFANIPIYVVCPTLKGISPTTINKIRMMGAQYFHEYRAETDSYKCGYWNVPLVGRMLEKTPFIKENIIIHIDLDMTLMKAPTRELLTPSKENLAKIGVNEHRPTARYPDFKGKIYAWEANTGFIVSWRYGQFYQSWYERLQMLTKVLDQKNPEEYSIYEERVIDIMYFEESFQVEFEAFFQVNGDVSKNTDEEILNMTFFHGHANMKERNQKYWATYLRRMVGAKRNHINTKTA